ncbi:hypothetical protein [Mesobacillus zeae]|uniref:Uncharacterized protein n=1 Tax=Mesobacillus zeae TaxID=1917180 RepID=A0A398BAB6_9BACI|nr:hypothetical protein [Mesobacillus zeae]RID85788.1 hypothetical protein D1970_09655 [Mesobacillus zeae]
MSSVSQKAPAFQFVTTTEATSSPDVFIVEMTPLHDGSSRNTPLKITNNFDELLDFLEEN